MKAPMLAGLMLTASMAQGRDRSVDLNMAGSGALVVGTLEAEGQLWAEFRLSGGGYLPNAVTSFGAHATIAKHAYYRVTPSEAGELATQLEKWDSYHHNDMVFEASEEFMSIQFIGSDGVTWSPEFLPIVVASIQEWVQVGERGHMHGGIYVALPAAQVPVLAAVLRAWSDNPVVTPGLVYELHAQ